MPASYRSVLSVLFLASTESALQVTTLRTAPKAAGQAFAGLVIPTFASRKALPTAVQEVVDARFKKSYPAADVQALWQVLRRAYGNEDNALQAVRQNPTILNPSYTNPPGLVTRSKAALVEVLGEEEALEVMLQNPAVLQCGADLSKQPADQIKSFAGFRSTIDKLPDQAPLYALCLTAVLLAVAIGGKNGALPADADAAVEGVGQLFAAGGAAIAITALALQNVAQTGGPKRNQD